MTVREQILYKLKTDLLKIKPANGYINTIDLLFPVLIELDDVSVFPSVCFFFGEENAEPLTEDEQTFTNTINLIILTHIQGDTETDNGEILTNMAETWISDYDRFFSSDDCTIFGNDEIKSAYIVKKDPFVDYKHNRQTTGILMKIIYTN